MAHVDQAVDEAAAADPKFKRLIESVSTLAAIDSGRETTAPTFQPPTDEELFQFMKTTYTEAVSSLRRTNKPYPGTREKMSVPASAEVKKMLLEQFDKEGIDKDYVDKYAEVILTNYDVFSANKFDLGCASHYEHVIEKDQDQTPPYVKQYKIPFEDEDLLAELAASLTASNAIEPQF